GVVREIQMLNAHDYATYVNQANWHATPDSLRIRGDSSALPYGGRTGSIRPDSIARLYGAGIDWQRAIFRTAATRDLQLAFSGGDGSGSYAVSGNYFDQDGAIRGSGFGRGGCAPTWTASSTRSCASRAAWTSRAPRPT